MHGGHGVFGVLVRADTAGVFFVEHRAADHDERVFFLFAQQADRILHAAHGGRHQSAQADDLDIVFNGGVHDDLRVHVLAEVDHLVAVVFEQHLDDVLADVVDVPLDGGEDDLLLLLLRQVGHRFVDHRERRFGCFGAHQKLREEDAAVLKSFADLIESGDEHLVDQVHRGGAVRQCFTGLLRCHLFDAAFNAGREGEVIRLFRGIALTAVSCCSVCARFFSCAAGLRCAVNLLRQGLCQIDVGQAVRILVRQRQEGVVGEADVPVEHIDDAQRQAVQHGQRQELCIQVVAAGQPEGDIAHAEHGVAAQFVPDPADRLQCDEAVLAAGGDGQRQRVEDDVLLFDAVRSGGIVDFLSNSDSPVGCLRDAVLVEQQTDDHTAVLFHEREESVHLFLLARDGVEQRFAVVDAHRALHGGGVAGIQAQRQGTGRLQFFDKPCQDGRLVDIGHADVDVEDRRIAVLLAEAFREQHVQIAFFKRGTHLFADAGVDALADQERFFADHHGAGERGDDRPVFLFGCLQRNVLAARDGHADMVRSCAAAATGAGDAECRDLPHVVGELLRVDVIAGHAVLAAGQACIGIGDDRHGTDGEQPRDDRDHLLRSEAAVDAQRIDAEAFQHGHHGLRCAAGEHLAVFVKDHGDEDGQCCILFRAEDGGFGLVAVGHGLDQHKIRAGLFAEARYLAVQLDGFFKRKIAHRLEQFAGGAHIDRDVGIFTAGAAARFFGVLHRGGDDLFQIVRVLQAVGAESVRVDDIAAGFEVSGVQRDDLLRVGEVPCLGKFAGLEAARLQDAAGAAVEIQPASSDLFSDIFPVHVVPLSDL